MKYLDHINRAVNFIEENLFNDLGLDGIAREAGLSRWYFQRIFRAVAGDTVKEYIIKRRLSHAARSLRDSNQKIIDVAFACEFDSHEGFTRAFKRVFEMTPSEFRNLNPKQVLIPHKAKITEAYLSHLYGGITMKPNLKNLDSMTAVGLTTAIKGVNDPDSENLTRIPLLWKQFRTRRHEIPDGLSAQRVALICSQADNQPAVDLEYLAGVVVPEGQIPVPGFEIRTIPKGLYAEFIHRGPMKNIGFTMNYIYGSWLPKSGHEIGEGPEVAFFPPNFDPASEEASLQLFIPLRER